MQKTVNRPLQSERVIVCEGADEFDIFSWLRRQRKLAESDVEILDAKGRNNLPGLLGDLRYMSGGSAVKLVAVVMDVEGQRDQDIALAKAVHSTLNEQGFKGFVEMLPSPDGMGALETVVRQSAPSTTLAYECTERWERCLSLTVETRTQAQIDKAWTHVWLASQGEIYSRVGFAVKTSGKARSILSVLLSRFDTLMDRVLTTPL